MPRIVSILPKGEGFTPESFGAVSLCVRDFTRASRYRDETLIIGGTTASGFDGIQYRRTRPISWYENRTRAYANASAGLIREYRADLAEVHNRPQFIWLLARKTDVKLALHLHNDPQEMDASRTPAERLHLIQRCSVIYCVSEFIRSRFLDGLGDNARVRTVHNGLDAPATLPPKEKLLVFAGRMTEGKGGLLLAQALRLALPALPGWQAVIIGSTRHSVGTKPGTYEAQVMEALAPLGSQVEQPGFLGHEATLRWFARASLAVTPSVWAEPFGRTALEALASGCALISSGRGGLAEVTGDAALTLTDLTPETLADAIRALARDEPRRENLARAGRIQAARFALDLCARALDDARDFALTQEPRL